MTILKPNFPRITANTRIKQYYDVDNQRFIRDKLESIVPTAWADLVKSEEPQYDINHLPSLPRLYDSHRKSNNNAWFIPKDNDWDEEIAKEDEMIKDELKTIARDEMKQHRIKLEYMINSMNCKINADINSLEQKMINLEGRILELLRTLDYEIDNVKRIGKELSNGY